ncbi:MAG: adenylosuccinate synthase [bacterium]
MQNLAIIGLQWGDEGKGKIIDCLARDYDYIVRFQGGNNAGHTVFVSNKEFIFHLIPSGCLYKDKHCVIGNGVAVNPAILLDEIENLEREGIELNLHISYRCHLIMPYHIAIDEIREKTQKIGTTKRGIGPCYTDKVARCGIVIADMLDRNVFKEKVRENLNQKSLDSLFNPDKIVDEYLAYFDKIKDFVCDTRVLLEDAILKRKSILFEGAQGTLLDIDFGTYPYVTSTNPTIGGIGTGTGIPPRYIENVIGVMKAYSTRVGEGPFPTEIKKDLGESLREKGREYGATTGRPRRCGWLDLPAIRYSCKINGITSIAITKLDVLDCLSKIMVCTKYKIKGKIYGEIPQEITSWDDIEPIYEEFPGWEMDIGNIKEYDNLPKEARNYIEMIKDALSIPISLVSVGKERNQNIEVI